MDIPYTTIEQLEFVDVSTDDMEALTSINDLDHQSTEHFGPMHWLIWYNSKNNTNILYLGFKNITEWVCIKLKDGEETYSDDTPLFSMISYDIQQELAMICQSNHEEKWLEAVHHAFYEDDYDEGDWIPDDPAFCTDDEHEVYFGGR